MNKKCFRVIFSKTLQRLIVTSELAKAEGKSKESSPALPSLQLFAAMRPLVFSLCCALGLVAFSESVVAETLIIQADKSAPKNQQPIILQTANGLPQVNIQTPNDKGLSHNKYSKFDVDTQGAILNNSRTNVQTQQAGWVQGNPYLARGEAKVILNEVNSNDPSLLKGYVEVAGQKADVIIANPAGIHCQGCGIINSDRATFTTGAPQLNQGDLEQFVVEKGKIQIDGRGLDNSRVDYTELLAREVQINSGVWSKKEAKVITGKNTVKRGASSAALQIIHSHQPLAEETQPQFAVDVGALGGMYANKIHLIGTENGVGVRNAGHIGASHETLQIDSQGRIINSGTLNAQQTVSLNAKQGIENRGKIENRQGDIQLASQRDINQDGVIVARQGNITKRAENAITQQGESLAKGNLSYRAQSVNASPSALIAAGVNVKDTDKGEVRELDAQSAQGKEIEVVTSGSAKLQGKNVASGNLNVNAESVNLNHSQNSAYNIAIQAQQGDVEANAATLTAVERLQLNTPQGLSTQSSHLTATEIETEHQSLNAAQATWKQTGDGDFRLKGEVINTQSGNFSTQGNFFVDSQRLENAQGILSSGKSLTLNVSDQLNSTGGELLALENVAITSGSLNNDAGLVYAKQNITLNQQGALSNQQTQSERQGIIAGQNLMLKSESVNNTAGNMVSQAASLMAQSWVNNQGRVRTENDLNLNTSRLENHQGSLIATKQASLAMSELEQQNGHIEAETLHLNTTNLSSTNGSLIFANRLNTKVANTLNNQDSRIVAETLHLNATNLNSTNGSLIFANNLNAEVASTLNNQDSRIVAGNEAQIITTGSVINQNGTIGSQKGSLSLNTSHHLVDNRAGKIVAAQKLNLQSGLVDNTQGLISAKNIVLNTHNHRLNNQETLTPERNKGIIAQDTLQITAHNLDNQRGNLYSNHHLALSVEALSNQQGDIFASQQSELTATTIDNSGGKIRAGEELTLNADRLSQITGQIGASVLHLTAKQLNSTQNSEISGQAVNVGTDTLDNQGSRILAQQDLQIAVKNGLQNQEGTLASIEGNLTVNTAQSTLNSHLGIISAQNGKLDLQTGELNNQGGKIRAKHAILNTHQHNLINRDTLNDQDLGIIVEELDLQTSLIDNHAGQIIAKNNSTIAAHSLNNEKGELLVKNTAVVNAAQVNNQGGKIASTSGNLSLTAQSALNNALGTLSAAQHLTVETQGVNNQEGNITTAGSLTLETYQQQVDNQRGVISAAQQAEINTGAINNQQGLLRADQQLNLNTHNQQLDNRYTQGQQQGIMGLGNIVLQGISTLLNQQGTLYATGNITAAIQTQADNAAGVIQAQSTLNLSANTLNNQAGFILGKTSEITAQQLDNRAVSDKGSRIAGETLILNVEQLDNQGTKAKGAVPEQGIQGRDVTLKTHALANQQGGIYSQNSANISANTRLDNQQGELLSANAIAITNNGALRVNNQGGLIQGNNQIELNAQALEAEGTIKTAGDLAISLKEGFTLNNAFEVGNNLTFSTAGDFENNVVQAVKNKATFSANQIINHASSELSANDITIHSQKLTNRGLIDGNKTRIESVEVNNLGTGRIYGNHLAFKSDNLQNLDENKISATIGARETLKLGVDKILNSNGSTIISLGNIKFGKTLDHDDNVQGTSSYVKNHNAVIEAMKGISFNSLKVENLHLLLKLEEKQTSKNKMFEYSFVDESQRYSKDTKGLMKIKRDDESSSWGLNKHVKNLYALRLPDGRESESWREYDYTRTITETMVVPSDYAEAKILSGEKIDFFDTKVQNQDSKIIASTGIEHHNGASIDNNSTTGKIEIVDSGNMYGFYNGEACNRRVLRKCVDHYRTTQSYSVNYNHKEEQTKNLGLWDYITHQSGDFVLGKNIENQTFARDVNLESISITTESPELSLGAQPSNTLDIPEGTKTHILLTPAIDEKDKNRIISSGQVIGKLDTQIDGAEVNTDELKLPTIKTHLVKVDLPQSSLYRINPDHPQGYLVETDPRFTQREQWLNSDYLLDQLRYEHSSVQKRLGDGFYEQRLINEQINQLTGRRFIVGYNNDFEQYRALMNSGVKYAKQFNLTVGVGLTVQQMSELTTDMVWLVNKEITLPNGQKITALTPQVYLVARNSDITSRGAVISANEIIGNVDNLTNSGVIAGRDLTRIYSNQLENRGIVVGDTVDLSATQNLVNLGGRIEAANSLTLSANNLDIGSTLSHSRSQDGNFERTILDQIGSVKVTGTGGSLNLLANNLNLKGALIESNGTVYAKANNITADTLQTQNKEHYNGNADNYYRLDQRAEVGSQITGKNGVTLFAHNDVSLRQAELESTNGNTTVIASNGNLSLSAGRVTEDLSTASKSASKGWFSKRTTTTEHDHHTDRAATNKLSGQNVTLYAGNQLNDEGSHLTAQHNLHLEGKQGVNLSAAQHYYQEHNESSEKKSGFGASFSKGVARIGYGRTKQEEENTYRSTQHQGTQLTAAQGNITVLSQSGNVIAQATQFDANKDITVQGKSVEFLAAIDSEDNAHQQRSSSKGTGLGILYNPFSNVKARYNEQAGQGSAGSLVGKGVTAAEALSKTEQQLKNGVSPYLTAQRKQSERFTHQETAKVVEMNAGGNLTVRATEGNITSQGGHFTAQGEGDFWAKDTINMGVATTEQRQQGSQTQKGIDIDGARRLTEVVGAYTGKEKQGNRLTQEHASVLSFGGKAKLHAEQGDVVLVGTQFANEADIEINAGRDIKLDTAKTTHSQEKSGKSHGIGEAVVSETERFSGYNRKRENQAEDSVRHQGSIVASTKGNVTMVAGNNYSQTSSQVLAKGKTKIEAERINIEAAHNTHHSERDQSDLKVGQFSRIISPIFDVINAVENTVKNKDASDRLKAAQAMGAAAKAYSAYNEVSKGVLLRAETGIGVAHSRQNEQSERRDSVGNVINAQEIELTARSGKISATHTQLTNRDEQGNRIAGGKITLTGKQGIDLNAGESTSSHQGKQQSSGVEVGTAIELGSNSDWLFYVKGGFNKGKDTGNRTTYHNSQIDTDTLTLNSGGDVNLNGTKANARTINGDIKGNLTITSLQDEQHQRSGQKSLSAKVEYGMSSGWKGDGSINANSGKGNFKQVMEQSGLFAEEGGYHITANNVHLEGGAIASTNPSNSELTTNSLTFKDIQNESEYRATSGGLSGGSSGFSPSLPMHEQGSDSTLTKATLTEGKITLNKDSQPQTTTAAALGINTDLNEANKQVNAPKDINKVLKEQAIISESVGNIVGAVDVFTDNLYQEAKTSEEKAKADFEAAKQEGDSQRIEKTKAAYRNAVEQSENWEIGGKYKQMADAITATFTLALAGKSSTAIATGAASPYINQAIKEVTQNVPELNIPSHILWGAVEAHLMGGNALSGAVAVGVGEATANYLAQAVYQKDPRELSEEEKRHISTLSQLTSAVASGLTTSLKGEDVTTVLTNLSIDSQATQNAVENNLVKPIIAGAKVIYKVAKKRVKNGKISAEDLKETLKEEGLDIADNLITLSDGVLTWDDALAVIDLAVGTEFNRANKGEAAKILEELNETINKKVIKKVDGYEVRQIDVGSTGQWNKHLNKPEPNTIYKLNNGHQYKTDELGRVAEAKGSLKLETMDRNTYQQRKAGGDCRLESDCGGHLLASMFGGAGEGLNLVAMDGVLNGAKGKWYSMEQQWRKALEQGQKVEVSIKPIYSGNSRRPDAFDVSYSINGAQIKLPSMKNTPTGE